VKSIFQVRRVRIRASSPRLTFISVGHLAYDSLAVRGRSPFCRRSLALDCWVVSMIVLAQDKMGWLLVGSECASSG
jgi:hypothetical protein